MNHGIPFPSIRSALVALAAGSVLVAGCGLGTNGTSAPQTYTQAGFDPKNFVDPRGAGNPFFPLKPGMQWLREGTTLVGNRQVPNKVVVTITDAVRVIHGVKAVLSYDHSVAAGEVVQESLDYFALDKDGAVWVLGGATEQFEAGRFVAVDEVWMHGVEGSKAGTLMPADPTLQTPHGRSPSRRARAGTRRRSRGRRPRSASPSAASTTSWSSRRASARP